VLANAYHILHSLDRIRKVACADTWLYQQCILRSAPPRLPAERPWGSIILSEVFYIPMVTEEYACLAVICVRERTVWVVDCEQNDSREATLANKVIRCVIWFSNYSFVAPTPPLDHAMGRYVELERGNALTTTPWQWTKEYIVATSSHHVPLKRYDAALLMLRNLELFVRKQVRVAELLAELRDNVRNYWEVGYADFVILTKTVLLCFPLLSPT
jgi:hypothetical protein